jgi:adenine-specific DNA-methyltransferase
LTRFETTMARRPATPKTVATLKHDADKRRNIPTAEFQSVLDAEEQNPVEARYPRNTDLDPQLVWRGKDEKEWSDLVVHAPPLSIQEKIHPKALIEDLLRQTRADRKAADLQLDLFADFNGVAEGADKTEFYQHDQNWSNRMILGDSLQVMASLAEREGLRGKVQCIYFDPPYGITFNSNFQWSTTSRDVKDGNAAQITREPEQVKAFRDTWRDGIHSYLTYLRDRLTVARDLLTDSGSIFVQIGVDHVHRVRALMDEVFGEGNVVTEITVKKKGSQKSSLLDTVNDFILWYSKSPRSIGDTKFRPLFEERVLDADTIDEFSRAELPSREIVNLKNYVSHEGEALDFRAFPRRIEQELPGARLLRPWPITNGGQRSNQMDPIDFEGNLVHPPRGRCWSHTSRPQGAGFTGMQRVLLAGRLLKSRGALDFIRYLDDFPFKSVSNWWDGFGGASDQVYVVQTNERIVERCLLMVTDPGDLVLDPTCGSGTAATVAEQWGRRWITIDTSRVALALARARVMGARFPYYLLADSREGQLKEAELTRSAPSSQPVHGFLRQGFVYRRAAYITSSVVANNAEIDVIWEKWQSTLEPLRRQLSVACGLKKTLEEWEIPREAPDHWPPDARPLLSDWWKARIARQKEMDKSLMAKAKPSYFYDKPYADNRKVRVAGPFTVESLSPHRMLDVDENDELIDRVREESPEYGARQSFPQMILEHLKTAGVQQAHKEDRITFTALTPWPGDLVCAEGRFSSDQWSVVGGRDRDHWSVAGGQGGGQLPVGSDQIRASGHRPPITERQPPATGHRPPANDTERRAAIFIGPEFGTVQRPDLVAAAREAADAGFDVLIACAFNYEAHTTEFNKLGRIPVLKARMNADLHMAGDLKNTGKGNLFVIFGEPDITVVSGQWLVASNGRMVANFEHAKELSGLGSLEEINRSGRDGLSALGAVSSGRAVRTDQPGSAGGGVGRGEHRGGSGEGGDPGVPPVPGDLQRFAGGDGDPAHPDGEVGAGLRTGQQSTPGAGGNHGSDAQRSQTLTALQSLSAADFPLSLTTDHRSQVTVHGVDVFHPQTGEVRSDGPEGIACWFIDTDYNEESFFVRHAYFLGANDPYSALKTTLKAEIDPEAWATLNSDTSRPFDKPRSGRIAVKVINHLGDEVMKVFRV